MNTPSAFSSRFILILSLCALAVGLGLRFYRITANEFVFYDEGFYLAGENRREMVEFLDRARPWISSRPDQMAQAVYSVLGASLSTGKCLWIFLSSLRVFWGGVDDWFFPRVLSAVFGCLTLFVTYRFAWRFFGERDIAILSAALLAVLPSHVFYSRLAMQESMSTFLFITGFYFFLTARAVGWRLALSSLMLAFAYYSNYRLIVIPCLVAVAQICLSLTQTRRLEVRKVFWHLLLFVAFILLIGSIDDGRHLRIIVPWILMQGEQADYGVSKWYNFLSYPYYTFALETPLWGAAFWSAFWVFRREGWRYVLPFVLVIVQMFIFSFPSDKAARYICVVYPFMAMTLAYVVVRARALMPTPVLRKTAVVLTLLLTALLVRKSVLLAAARSDYGPAMAFILAESPSPKIVAGQKWVLGLYTDSPKNIDELPRSLPGLAKRFESGTQYLVLDPQAYISWGEGGRRFTPSLQDYLGFVDLRIPPAKTFPHFNGVLLERFVMDHNQDLLRSLAFLREAKDRPLGEIRIYRMQDVMRRAVLFLTWQQRGKI